MGLAKMAVPAFHILTHFVLTDSSIVICWTCSFVISGAYFVYFVAFILFLIENPVNSVDPDQTPHCVASDLGLHCLPMTP